MELTVLQQLSNTQALAVVGIVYVVLMLFVAVLFKGASLFDDD